jgi:hypothetical protein
MVRPTGDHGTWSEYFRKLPKVGRQEGEILAALANHFQLPCPRRTEAVTDSRM